MHPKILVGTVFSQVKEYSLRDWFKTVRGFTHPNFDFCAVDNSKDKKYHEKMFKFFSERKKKSNIGKLTVMHTPRGTKRAEEFLVDSANQLRRKFLDGKYDFLLYLECDIHPPPDILERLLSYNRQIISALYFIGDKATSYPMMGDKHFFIRQSPHFYIKSYLEGFYDIGEFDIPKALLSGGLGCVLIYKDILEKIAFRPDPNFIVHHDGTFAEDLWLNGIQNAYAPIMCRHENQNWDLQNKMIKSI